MLYISKDGELKNATTPNDVNLYKFMQELKLFKCENATNIEAGIDYLGVFNQTKFLRFELQEVIDKHIENFSSIDVGSITQDYDKVSVELTITFKDGTISNELLEIISK